jgi:hypothetical protein
MKMERTEVLDMMGELKLYRMKSAYDETLATAIKRKHEPQRPQTSVRSLRKFDCAAIDSKRRYRAAASSPPLISSIGLRLKAGQDVKEGSPTI